MLKSQDTISKMSFKTFLFGYFLLKAFYEKRKNGNNFSAKTKIWNAEPFLRLFHEFQDLLQKILSISFFSVAKVNFYLDWKIMQKKDERERLCVCVCVCVRSLIGHKLALLVVIFLFYRLNLHLISSIYHVADATYLRMNTSDVARIREPSDSGVRAGMLKWSAKVGLGKV